MLPGALVGCCKGGRVQPHARPVRSNPLLLPAPQPILSVTVGLGTSRASSRVWHKSPKQRRARQHREVPLPSGQGRWPSGLWLCRNPKASGQPCQGQPAWRCTTHGHSSSGP